MNEKERIQEAYEKSVLNEATMDTLGSRGNKAVIFDLNTVTIRDGKSKVTLDINEATALYRSLKRKLK